MEPYYQNETCVIYHGECLDVIGGMNENSIDSIVCDPPYGISFMSKKWDYDVPSVDEWREVLRVLKPGGHLLSFAGTRTQHRMCVNIEDAGFEIRDMIAWIFGSGFPKSHNISKALDRMAGKTGKTIGTVKRWGANASGGRGSQNANGYQPTDPGAVKYDNITAPATPEAEQWDGWGSNLKPALEPITLARKPLSEKTIAANVLKWGTGGINVDGCRVKMGDGDRQSYIEKRKSFKKTGKGTGWKNCSPTLTPETLIQNSSQGRFPANLIHDGSQMVLDLFPVTKSGGGNKKSKSAIWGQAKTGVDGVREVNQGTAARFFYQAKASKKDRGEGNTHITVKPTDLMRYLCRLITPPGGVVLDPWAGSGSTGKAGIREGFRVVLVDKELESCEIAAKRLESEFSAAQIK